MAWKLRKLESQDKSANYAAWWAAATGVVPHATGDDTVWPQADGLVAITARTTYGMHGGQVMATTVAHRA